MLPSKSCRLWISTRQPLANKKTWQEWSKKRVTLGNHRSDPPMWGVNEPGWFLGWKFGSAKKFPTFEGSRFVVGMCKYFRCGVVPLSSEIWKRLMMEAQWLLSNGAGLYEHVSIFLEWGWGLGERFWSKLIIYWWVLVKKQTDSDNDDVSWWSSYLSWFYPSFAVLMTVTSGSLCSPLPFNGLPHRFKARVKLLVASLGKIKEAEITNGHLMGENLHHLIWCVEIYRYIDR